MNPVYQPLGPCPCDHPYCHAIGTKLSKDGHLIDCHCPKHLSGENARRGKAGEANRHKALSQPVPNDEYPWTYTLAVLTQDKVGQQVPSSFVEFVTGAWYRRAMRQAEKKRAIGNEAYAAVYVEPEGGGAWLIVDVAPKSKL